MLMTLEPGPSTALPVGGLIARQPIVDPHGTVWAYELFDRSTEAGTRDTGSDISLLFNAMADSSNALGIDSKTIFINRTHQSLTQGHLDIVRPEKVVIEVGPVARHDPQGIDHLQATLAELRRNGYRLAFNHTVLAPVYKTWQDLADFVKLDMMAIRPEMLKPMVAAVRARTKARIVAEKVETAESLAAAANQGIDLFQGYWVGHPQVTKVKVVAPAHANVLQLFSLVRKQGEMEDIEALLKRDAVLGFNLLRMINSAGFGLAQKVTSFRHAVMLLGMQRLARWTALLLASSRSQEAVSVVGTTAVVRGRMMELLGTGHLDATEVDQAFMVGIFSMLDEMLAVDMPTALAMLDLSPQVSNAILNKTGTLGRMLALTESAESGDETTFAAAALELGFTSHHINSAHLEALVWTDSLAL